MLHENVEELRLITNSLGWFHSIYCRTANFRMQEIFVNFSQNSRKFPALEYYDYSGEPPLES